MKHETAKTATDSEQELLGINQKMAKQLQTTVGLFNTLKEFTSSPLQNAIETKIGDLAAIVIEQAFSRLLQTEEPKQENIIGSCHPSIDPITSHAKNPIFEVFKSIKKLNLNYEDDKLKIDVELNPKESK